MNVVVEIEGREALPVWVLPYVTSWRLTPDMLLKRLADPIFEIELPSWRLSKAMQQRKLTDPTHQPPLPFPAAFNIDIYGIPSLLPPVQWFEKEYQIKQLEQSLKDMNLPEYDGRNEWMKRSIEEFWKYESCYVWLDEFERWYEGFICWNFISSKDEKTDICFNPALPQEHAQYFRDTELPKLIPKALLNEEKQDELKKEELKPWLIADARDPYPEQPWYTPARYFARQLIKENPGWAAKNNTFLANKVAPMLAKVGIYKRGGLKPPIADTILKAFSKIDFS